MDAEGRAMQGAIAGAHQSQTMRFVPQHILRIMYFHGKRFSGLFPGKRQIINQAGFTQFCRCQQDQLRVFIRCRT